MTKVQKFRDLFGCSMDAICTSFQILICVPFLCANFTSLRLFSVPIFYNPSFERFDYFVQNKTANFLSLKCWVHSHIFIPRRDDYFRKVRLLIEKKEEEKTEGKWEGGRKLEKSILKSFEELLSPSDRAYQCLIEGRADVLFQTSLFMETNTWCLLFIFSSVR